MKNIYLWAILPGASGHAALTMPISRQQLSEGSPGACCSGPYNIFQQGCYIGCDKCYPDTGTQGNPTASDCANQAIQPTLPDKFRTIGVGAASTFPAHPWQAPGRAPTIHPCGGNRGASWAPYDKTAGPSQASWKAGYKGETAWWTVANHGGGYQYRLCPSDDKLSDKCFEDHVLPFHNNKVTTLKWVDTTKPDVKAPVNDLSEGTHPPNSVWRRNEVSAGAGGITPVDPGLSGSSIAYQHDHVQVPMYPGTYVLQFRWDCEQTSQIWAHCADITIDPVPYNMYQITLAWDGWKCLNVPDSDEIKNGHEVNIWDCNGQDDQKWIYDNGKLRFKADQNYCLDVPGGNLQSGQPMWMWECDGSPNQQFGFNDDAYAIYPQSGNNVCLDVAGGDTTNANDVQLWECNGADNQMWIIPDARNYQSGNTCIDLPGGNNKNGQPIWLWECNGAEHQAFVWTNWNMRYGPDLSKCLDLPGGDTTNGKQIWLWDCDGGNNQRWGYNQDTGGIFFADDLSKCIDAGNANNGAPLMIWDCNQLPQQQWAMPSLINSANQDEDWNQRWKIHNSTWVV